MQKKRAILLVIALAGVLVAVVAAVLIGAGASVWWLLDGGGAPGLSDEDEGIAGMVALGGGRAVFVQGYGFSEPMLVRGVHVEGSALREDWRWSALLGHASYGWMWRHAGDVVVGELHENQGSGSNRLACFHVERGLLGEVPGTTRGAFVLSEDGSELLVRTTDALELYRTAPFARVWRLEAPDTGFVPRLGLSPTLALLYDGAIRVARRSDGGLAREITDGREVAGIDRARGELMWRREGRIVVESLGTGAERLVLDLAGGPAVVDGMEEPTLLGSHAGRWIFIYATELDHSFTSNNARPWTRNAPRTLAAVDPESGAIAWRSVLGPWPRWMPISSNGLYDERELPAELLLYSDVDAEGGGGTRHLAYVSLADGALRWQLDYPEATRSNVLFTTFGEVAYLRLREASDGPRSALVRFEGGRLTAAIWLADYTDVREPMVRADEAWIPTGRESWALVGPDLRPRASGGPEPAPRDARAWALERLGLADDAR